MNFDSRKISKSPDLERRRWEEAKHTNLDDYLTQVKKQNEDQEEIIN